MAEKHDPDKDGALDDGVSFYPADATRLAMYDRARKTLQDFQETVLLQAGATHDRLFVATLDGTGNDIVNDPEHPTNVGAIYHQIKASQAQHPNVDADYVSGPGTASSILARTLDNADGYSSEERAETMYKKFIDRAWQWKQQDPEAHISIAGIGFSRGAEEVAIFARLVQERGIQDPRGATYEFTSDHLVKHVEYTRPALVAPGQVAQAVVLMDPVGTGNEIHNDDRRLPPSVISGIQLIATDERRSLFKSDHIIDPGITPDGRFAGIDLPGAHSDVGGGYHRDGLSSRAGNLVVDYLNGLSDQPFLSKQPEPDDPRLNVVHRSEEGMLIYRVTPKVDRLDPAGYNERLVPRREAANVPDPYGNEPRDEALNRRFERQRFPDGPLPDAPHASIDADARALSAQVERMLEAARNDDWSRFRQGTSRFAAMESGQSLLDASRAAVDAPWQPPLLPPAASELASPGWQR